ncbi:recombinase family protein [Clostridium folliculivorans]|uniref:Resolvase n=1 Tax=Clostridium folliculivorans TaxID=2886038 RepID=A0A9W5Y2M3_9CLOT|nr:recombinase family protein [Clostridium folliculivorans]GKU25459.1 resolvase [Clostridium folliculivorans]GKU28481.1 resolvase [Clostridium folliculivorans]
MIAAIYSRKSRLSEKGESIENQIELCKQYGNNLGVTNFLIYEDEGFSGGNVNRPEFQKLLSDAKKKRFDYLICYRLDRISRNVADFSTTLEMLQKNKIEFVSIREQFDTSSPMGRAMVYISSVFAQLERETIAERIKDNMLELAKTGRWLGGTPPLGFKSVPVEYVGKENIKKMYKLEVVEEEINIVKTIFSLYLEKKSTSTVSRYLCSNNVKGKNGGDFSRNTVLQILNNPVYTFADENMYNYFNNLGATLCNDFTGEYGLMVYNKREGGKKDKSVEEWIVSAALHPGIVPSKQWIKCQEILNTNVNNPSVRSNTSKHFLLSGLVKCGNCGSSMSTWSNLNKRTNKLERYYRCELRNRASNRCSTKMLNAYAAEEAIITALKNIDTKSIVNLYSNDKNSEVTKLELQNEASSLKKTLSANNKIIQGLVRKLALLEDRDTLKLIENEIKAVKNESISIEKRISEITLGQMATEDIDEKIGNITSNIKTIKQFFDYIDDIEIKRSVIKEVIESITWDNEVLKINLVGANSSLSI